MFPALKGPLCAQHGSGCVLQQPVTEPSVETWEQEVNPTHRETGRLGEGEELARRLPCWALEQGSHPGLGGGSEGASRNPRVSLKCRFQAPTPLKT